MRFLASSSWCARHGIKHLTTHKISVQPLLVFGLQMKQCQHKRDKLEVSSQSTCTRTNKHFISKMINKTKSTAVPTNVSVNCFRVRKHPLHQLQDIMGCAARLEASLGVLPLWEEAAEWKSSPGPKGRSCWHASASCSSSGFGSWPVNQSCGITPDEVFGVDGFCHVWPHPEDCQLPPPL